MTQLLKFSAVSQIATKNYKYAHDSFYVMQSNKTVDKHIKNNNTVLHKITYTKQLYSGQTYQKQ